MGYRHTESQGWRLLAELFQRGKRIFNIKDAVLAAQGLAIPQSQLKKILFNLTKYGYLLRLHRGLYVGIGLLPGQINVNPLVISSFLIQPSAISHWSALQYHGLTEQVPQIITAITTSKIITPSMRKSYTEKKHSQKKHAWKIAGIHYEYKKIKKEHFDLGLEKIWIDEQFRIQITDKERTLLDIFVSPQMFGGMGEALGILENSLSSVDIKKLVNYAIKYGNKPVIKRLGWALEYFGVPNEIIFPLLNEPINYYCRLDSSKPAKGPCEKRWMIQNNLIKGKNETIKNKNSN